MTSKLNYNLNPLYLDSIRRNLDLSALDTTTIKSIILNIDMYRWVMCKIFHRHH